MASTDCVDSLLTGFKVYDRACDIVSIFEWLYTEQTQLRETALRFERFPRVSVKVPIEPQSSQPPKGQKRRRAESRMVTPDFTVLLDDRRGVVGEIARIALHDNSVDRLCEQLANYDRITELPGPDGKPVPIDSVDVVLLVEVHLGSPAFNRIRERIESADHTYRPSRPPAILQFIPGPDRYVVQRLLHPANGRVGAWEFFDDGTLSIAPNFFTRVKTQRPFINDECPPLYLAVHLWSRVFPELAGSKSKLLTVTEEELGDVLRRHQGIRASSLRAAMEFLERCGLAAEAERHAWQVAFSDLPARRGHVTLEEKLADRWCDPPRKTAVQRAIAQLPTPPGPDQGKLF